MKATFSGKRITNLQTRKLLYDFYNSTTENWKSSQYRVLNSYVRLFSIAFFSMKLFECLFDDEKIQYSSFNIFYLIHTWSLAHCILPIHLGAFLQACLAPNTNSVWVNWYVPVAATSLWTSFHRASWARTLTLKIKYLYECDLFSWNPICRYSVLRGAINTEMKFIEIG